VQALREEGQGVTPQLVVPEWAYRMLLDMQDDLDKPTRYTLYCDALGVEILPIPKKLPFLTRLRLYARPPGIRAW